MSYHHIGEEFELDGKTFVAKECNSRNACYYCAFGNPTNNREAEMCTDRKCESGKRMDEKNVRFKEVK